MKKRKLAIELGKREILLEQARASKVLIDERKETLLTKVREEMDSEALETLEKELKALKEEETTINKDVNDLDKKVKEINEQLDKDQEKKTDQEVEEGDKDMAEVKIVVEETAESAERSAINAFIRSKGVVRAGFTSVEGAAVIPTDNKKVFKVSKAGEELNLGALITTEPVTTGSGSHPVLKKTDAVLSTVAELEKNPELANPAFLEVDWKVETHRGAVPISQESIDDAAVDLVDMVENHVNRMSVNTVNAKVAAILKTFTAKTVKTTDEIKSILNVDLDPAYNKQFVMSQSFFQLADTVKDANNNYMMQPDITSPTGFKFLGIQIAGIAKDTQLGTAKQATAFLGDLKEAAINFDRKQISARWVDSDIYGQKLQAGARFDVKKADAKAGYFLTATVLDVVTPPVA